MRFALYLVRRSEWFANQRRRLQLNGKGSAEVEFQFGTSYDRLLGSHGIKPIDDFSVAVPFAEIMHDPDSEEDEFEPCNISGICDIMFEMALFSFFFEMSCCYTCGVLSDYGCKRTASA